MDLSNLLLDVLLAVILVHGLISGWLRGFVRVVFQKLRKMTALIGALLLARPIGNLLGEKYLLDPMTDEVERMLTEALDADAANASAAELSSELPLLLKGLLNIFNFDVAERAAEIDAAGVNAFNRFATAIAAPAANMIGAIIAFIVVYFVLKLFLRVIVCVVNAIFCLPGLRFLNKVLGAVAGVFFAAIFGWIVVTLVGYLFTIFAGDGIAFIENFNIEKTWIAKYFYQMKPLEFILSI